jgi:hypothetical protein
MWMLSMTRRELLDLIMPPRQVGFPWASAPNLTKLEKPRPETAIAVWPSKPIERTSLPSAIVVPDGGSREFLAWATTYLRDFRPFTAFCRVVDYSLAQLFFSSNSEEPSLRGFEGICSGLVVGEALAQSRGRVSARELTPATCSATLSFAIGRTLAVVSNVVPPQLVCDLWAAAQGMTDQPSPHLMPSAVQAVWSTAIALMDGRFPVAGSNWGDPSVLEASMDLRHIGEIGQHAWDGLTRDLPGLPPDIRKLTSLPREGRVGIVDMVLRDLIRSAPGKDERRSFLAGFITHLLGPGSFDHFDFLIPLLDVFHTSSMWYGLCAALSARERLGAANSLSRRIVRDLLVPDRFVDHPRCDISLDEFMLFGSGASPNELITSRAGRLDIDILPGVTTSVRWPRQGVSADEELKKVLGMELRRTLFEMEDTASRWGTLTERLRSLIEASEGSRPTSPKRGGKKK